jgi:hypothetical protein
MRKRGSGVILAVGQRLAGSGESECDEVEPPRVQRASQGQPGDMVRVRSLEGREAGVLAGIIQGMSRLALGRRLNPTEVQAHAPRAMLASFLSNMILSSGR